MTETTEYPCHALVVILRDRRDQGLRIVTKFTWYLPLVLKNSYNR